MKNKIICTLLVFILLISYSLISTAENNLNEVENNTSQNTSTNSNTIDDLNKQKDEVQDKINQKNSELEYVENEISATLLQIQRLDDSIRDYENQINELNIKVKEYENTIEKTKQDLEDVTKDYYVKDTIVRERLVEISKNGEISFLDVLLQSKSLTEFLSTAELMRQLTKADIDVMNQVRQQKENMANYKQKIENENAQTKVGKAKAEQISIVLENTKTLQQGYINNLKDNEKKLNDEITKYKQEQERIENIIMQVSTNQSVDIQYTGGPLIWPVAKSGSVITSSYGYREHPIQGIVKLHTGVDIGGVGFGAPIVAVLDGVVSYAAELGSYGNCVMIDHGNGITTLYGHGQKILTEKGKVVKQGDLIMEVGSTGNSTGPHCHFEVRINGYTQNPLNYVKAP